MTSERPTKPRAFVIEPQAQDRGRHITITDEPDAFATADAAPQATEPVRRGLSWAGILASALGSLALLAIGLWVDHTVRDLMQTYPALGVFGIGLAALAAIAFAVVIGREAWGVLRQRRIARLAEAARQALATGDDRAAVAIAAAIVSLYSGRPDMASARAEIARETETIIDADDRLALVERAALAPLDARARYAVANAARQVSLVTAVSPRAVIDVGFTLFAAARLVRQVASIYGGRPGFLGAMRLARSILTQLLVTGGMATGDSLIGQAMGHGLAARLSAKAGEGVLNGLLTARIGLAAIHVCRPLPFVRQEPPGLSDVAGQLFARGE